MADIGVHCPSCGASKVVRFGKGRTGLQRYECRNSSCPLKTFQFEYEYKRCQLRIDEITLRPPVEKIFSVRPL